MSSKDVKVPISKTVNTEWRICPHCGGAHRNIKRDCYRYGFGKKRKGGK